MIITAQLIITALLNHLWNVEFFNLQSVCGVYRKISKLNTTSVLLINLCAHTGINREAEKSKLYEPLQFLQLVLRLNFITF